MDVLCGRTVRLSVPSFYQVNHPQAEVLYGKALEFAGLTGTELAVDLYCGAGTITQVLAGKPPVIGGEIVRRPSGTHGPAARRNGVENVEFLEGDAADVAAELARRQLRPDVICVDPPRKGLAPEVIASIAAMAPPAGGVCLLRPRHAGPGREALCRAGLPRPPCPWPVDLFPRTRHVRRVCLLSKLQSKEHIEIEVKMDELDLTAAEKKATYEEIKAYVLEHTGLKVSHLYIAQVKQKYGIIERENYNKPKSEDARQPQCPPEKERAITEALKHFGMI